jgi:predicted AAA+ superfamily ATPase
MIEDYVNFLEQSNLIYVSNSIAVGKKESLKGRPKIYIADVAIRNAVLKPFDIMSNGEEMQVTIETLVFRHLISFYQNAPMVHIGYYQKLNESQKEEDIIVIELPKEKILCGVNYRNNANLTGSDAIIALSKEEGTKVTSAFVIIKVLRIMAIAKHDTLIPVLRIPALAFIYLLGRAEAKGENLKLKYKVICHFAIMYKIHFSGLPGFSSYFLLAFFQ